MPLGISARVYAMRPRSIYKRKWDDRGVASTVGTIMALLVFLTFLSLIVNQYVPVWMKDSEAAHMNSVLGQFGAFKGDVDLQILAAQMALFANRHYVPVTAFSPVSLGVDGIPIFASPTTGMLTVKPDEGLWSAQFTYLLGSSNYSVDETASGHIKLEVFNRYFVPQSIVYESGGVIRYQQDGQTVRGEPTIEIFVSNGTVDVTLPLVTLYGTGGAAGTGTEGIQSKLVALDLQTYEDLRSDVWINHTSDYAPAWAQFYNNTLSKAYGVKNSDFSTCTTNYCYTRIVDSGRLVSLIVKTPFYEVKLTYVTAQDTYTLSVRLANDYLDSDPTVPAVRTLTISHAHVNIVIGEQGSTVNPV